MARCTFCLLFFLFVLQLSSSKTKKETSGEEESEKWKKKDIRDYNEADIERLFEQWEVRIFISSRFGALSDLVNIILSHTVNYSTILVFTVLLFFYRIGSIFSTLKTLTLLVSYSLCFPGPTGLFGL